MLDLGLAFLCTLSFVMSMVAGISHKCINSHFNQCTWLFSCALDYSDFHICLISIFFFFMLSDSWYLKVGELIVNSHFFFSFFSFFFMLSDSWYLKVGESIVNSLNLYTKVEGGFASVKDVTTMQLEDHQHSFFLAET